MNESSTDLSMDVESLEDQLDSLFHELELAILWKRPSILFAIYNSTDMRRMAQDALEKLILQSGQDVVHYQIEYEENLNLTQFVSEIKHKENSVFYIDPLNSEGKNSQIGHLISVLNSCRGYLVEHLVRVVFWLTENEALNIAQQAPDFWSSRHRIFEFVHEQAVEEGLSVDQAIPLLEKGEKIPMAISSALNDEGISCESALVFDLSEGDEPTVAGINLLLMLGVENWKEGNYQKACEPLQAALAIAEQAGNQAHQAMCHKAIALVRSDSGEFDEAIQAYTQVVVLEPENVAIWNNIGSLCQKAGRSEEALNAYNKALKMDPNDPVSWNGLGNLYTSTGRLEEAITSYRKAIQFNADYITPWVKLADVLSRQNRNEDALYAYMKTVEMDKKNIHAWSEIGSIYFKAGSYEQAIDAYKKAMMLGVASAALYTNMAYAYTYTGYHADAIPLYQKAIELNNDNIEKAVLWNKLGDAHRRVNDYENAVAAYEMADKLSTTLGEVAQALVIQAPAEHAFDGEAAQVMEATVIEQTDVVQTVEKVDVVDEDPTTKAQVEPGEVDLPVIIIEEDQELGQTEALENESANVAQATELEVVVSVESASASQQSEDVVYTIAELETAFSSVPVESAPHLDPESAHLWAQLGSTYVKAGVMDRAIDAYHKAVNLDPTNGQTYYHLAQAYAQKMDLAEAVLFYRKSVELFPSYKDKAISFSRLGDLYRQMKDFANALEAFDVAIGLDPGNETILSGLTKIQEDLDQFRSLIRMPSTTEMTQSLDDHGDEKMLEAIETPAAEVVVDVIEQAAVVQDEPKIIVGEPVSQAASPINTNLNNANVWNELFNIYFTNRADDKISLAQPVSILV